MSVDKTTSWSYCESLSNEDPVLIKARERSYELGVQAVSAGVAALLTVVASTSKAQTVVEIGTGAGVSGVSILRGLCADAVLTTIDSDVEHLKAAKIAFADASIAANRTRAITGRATEVLPRLTDGAYDMVFIDADRASLAIYTEQALRLLKSGGLLMINDALDKDRVSDPTVRSESTRAMRDIIKMIRNHEQLHSALVPSGDGLLLAVKK